MSGPIAEGEPETARSSAFAKVKGAGRGIKVIDKIAFVMIIIDKVAFVMIIIDKVAFVMILHRLLHSYFANIYFLSVKPRGLSLSQ